MKLLLTSSGISKRSIAEALTQLVGKSPSDTKVGFIPTASNVEEGNKDWYLNQFFNLWRFGFNNIDIVDFSAPDVNWQDRIAHVDIVLISGGNTYHLLNQTRLTGFNKWMDEQKDSKVFVGISAGTIIMTPTIEIAGLEPGPDVNLAGLNDLTGLGWVDFEVEPHCDLARFDVVEEYSKSRGNAVYAIDDQSAVKVIDNKIEVISEGSWKIFNE